MHPTTPTTIANAPTPRKIEVQSSDANQPHLKFVVGYREAAKRRQKVFEAEEDAIQFARTKNPNFRRDPIRETEAQAFARVLLECTNRLSAYGKTIKDATDFFVQHLTATEKSCTAKKLVDEFVAAKEKEAASNFDLGRPSISPDGFRQKIRWRSGWNHHLHTDQRVVALAQRLDNHTEPLPEIDYAGVRLCRATWIH